MYRSISLTIGFLALTAVAAADPVVIPQIDGDFWQIAGDPDLGKYSSPKQQPVDFGIWQAADGTWQLWSCIRSTAFPGKTRLFYRWQANQLMDKDWTPMGIAMLADPNLSGSMGPGRTSPLPGAKMERPSPASFRMANLGFWARVPARTRATRWF